MKNLISFLLISSMIHCLGQSVIPSKEWQLKTAVLPLAENLRAESTVLGFDTTGKLVQLREGKNEMVCLADDPAVDGFSVAAYHKDLDAFMARGRQLKEEGRSFQEIFDIREKEVKEGTLKMPDKSTLYVMTGDISAGGEVANTKLRFVIYIPYSTAESTGLPLTPPVAGAPWIMNPGTHRAHIMVTPVYDAND